MELIIGSHVSYTKDKQLLGCVLETLSYTANAFMFYTGAPQNTMRSEIDDELTKKGLSLMKENNIQVDNCIVHAPYIVNLANKTDEKKYEFAKSFLKEELIRIKKLGFTKIVLHPGSYVSQTYEEGRDNIINALNECLSLNLGITICLETMAGKGSEIGISFDEIKELIDGVVDKEHIGVCLDTCHLNDSGYDICDFDKILDEFEQKIGLDKIKCIHINDSYNQKGAKKDRHSNIGYGTIGFECMMKIIYNPRLERVPKILETPYVTKDDSSNERLYAPYLEEITMIRSKRFNPNLIDEIRQKYK